MLIAISMWGRATFDYFTGLIYTSVKHCIMPAEKVSAFRYYFGLALLISTFIPSWVVSYMPELLSKSTRIYVLGASEIVFVASFFILGGDFWEKIRAIFTPDPIKIIRH